MDNQTINNTTQTSSDGVNILIVLIDSFILLLSLCGNSLVIYTISKERKLQTTCNYLLLNLSICDLVVVSLGTSIDIMLQFTNSKWILGLVMCRTLSPAMTMFYISGSLILIVISLDRYKMFVHPLKARYQRKHVKYAVFVVHLISLTSVIPFAVFSTITDGICYDVWPAIWYRKGYTIFLFVMQYALPLLIMGVAYAGIALSLMRNKSLFNKNFNIRRKEKNETTSTKSLVGLGSSPSQSHPKNNVNLNLEAYRLGDSVLEINSRPRSLNESDEPQKSSPYQSGVFESDAKRKCNAYDQHYKKMDENETKEVGYQQNYNAKLNKNANVTKIQFLGSVKTKMCEHENLILESSTDTPKSIGLRLSVSMTSHVKPNNNNDEKHICGKGSTFKRRFSNHLTFLSSNRRNAIRRRRPEEAGRNSVSPSHIKRDQRSNRALKMILLVVVVFAVFMLPMQIMSLLLDFGGKPTPEKHKIYAWFLMCSYFGSCTLNPFIYGLVDRTFRSGFKKFAKKAAGVCRCTASQTT